MSCRIKSKGKENFYLSKANLSPIKINQYNSLLFTY